MKPEARAYLDKAKVLSLRAQALLASGFPDEGGRAAYLAGLHGAQAFLFERNGRSPKTHSGVQTRFVQLAKNEPAFDAELRAFLGRSYTISRRWRTIKLDR